MDLSLPVPVPVPVPAPAGHRGVRALAALLRLHRPDGPDLLAADGHHRLLRRLHVHQEDLRRRQDRLKLLAAWLLLYFNVNISVHVS